jgi:hypothetical protein
MVWKDFPVSFDGVNHAFTFDFVVFCDCAGGDSQYSGDRSPKYTTTGGELHDAGRDAGLEYAGGRFGSVLQFQRELGWG